MPPGGRGGGRGGPIRRGDSRERSMWGGAGGPAAAMGRGHGANLDGQMRRRSRSRSADSRSRRGPGGWGVEGDMFYGGGRDSQGPRGAGVRGGPGIPHPHPLLPGGPGQDSRRWLPVPPMLPPPPPPPPPPPEHWRHHQGEGGEYLGGPVPHEFSEEALSSGGGAHGFLGGEGAAAAADSGTGNSGERAEEPENESAKPDTLDEAEIDPTISTVASNLSPVCVSRRLLSTRAYRRLALARQSGDPVKAGLTYVADEEEEDQEDQQSQGGDDTVAVTKAAAAATARKIASVGDGMDKGTGDENTSRHASANTAAAGDSGVGGNTNSSDGNAPKPEQGEEDDLYDDLYGGLTEETAGTSTVHSAKGDGEGRGGGDDAGVDSSGEDQDADALSERGTADAGGKADRGAEAGAERTASGVTEDIGIRAVMNALKRLEEPIFIPARPDDGASHILGNLAGGLPRDVAGFVREALSALAP